MFRTHNCGELSEKDKGKEVVLCGWVDSVRPHGSVNFLNLRDRYGITQIVFEKTTPLFKEIRNEFVIKIKGKVRIRPNPNEKIPTGKIEVVCSDIELINKCDVLPIDLSGTIESTEETRLRYRYLDLRRPEKMNKLIFRHKVISAVREYMNRNSFTEIETPLLIKSTPEGARDYVVPSRVNKGKFYALPQSPQLYKQILMIAGLDRYYQIARCLRDEDLRADRQPEHTQIDLEMSFVTSDEIRNMVEGLYHHIFEKILNIKLDKFPILTYEESMSRFGTDKPDIRFGLELNDVTSLMKKSEFNIFKQAEYIGCIVVDRELSGKDIDKLTDLAKVYRAKGLAYTRFKNNKLEEGVSKFLNNEMQEKIIEELKLNDENVVLFIADRKKTARTVLGQIRNALRDKFGLVKNDEFKFLWVKDFPLFSWNEDEKKWDPEHHMFSMPKQEFVKDFEKRPGEVLGDLWDLVLNGTELGSGSIRVNNPEVQERVMNFIGMDKKQAHAQFGFLLDAYKYGGPVHGGMGLGVDRTVALMLGINDIREVIAFPKNKDAQDLMVDAPSAISQKQLDELGLSLKK